MNIRVTEEAVVVDGEIQSIDIVLETEVGDHLNHLLHIFQLMNKI